MRVPLLLPIHGTVLGTIWNSCVTFGKFCDSSSPSVKNGDKDSTYFIGLLGYLNKLIFVMFLE